MSQPFKADAFAIVWSELSEQQQAEVRAKARWEKIPLSAALKWMNPEKWDDVVLLSEEA